MVRYASATDLSITTLTPEGNDGAWVVLQCDAMGRLRVHDDSGEDTGDDLIGAARDAHEDQQTGMALANELLKQILWQLAYLTERPPDMTRIEALGGV